MSRRTYTQQAQPLRVQRVTQEFFPIVSGPANQALALSQGLEQAGIPSPILTTTPGERTNPQLDGVTVRRFRPILAAPNFRPSPALQCCLMQESASAIHIHGWRNPVSDGALYAAVRRGIPVVVQAHGVANGHRFSSEALPIRTARQIYDAGIRRLVTRHATVVVASTQAEAQELRDYGFPAERIAVIPVGIGEQFFSAAPAERIPKAGTLRLLTVGRLSPLRNVEQIIRAVAILRAWGIAAQLRVVGPEVRLAAGETMGYRRQLEQLAFRLGVADAVVFTGPRSGDLLLDEYRAADVFVCTALYENFGQPIAEAAAMGLPIVATPVGVAVDLLEDSHAGYLVPFQDTSATAAVLRRLYDQPQLCLKLGQHARQRATLFDWQKIVPRFIEIYTNMLHASTKVMRI
jgi:glycosyltransferase involved in cell wall biosynthesis